MKILELANKLKKIYDKHGDIEVMFVDPNSGDGPYAVTWVSKDEAGPDEYPEDWNMPDGFKFVRLAN